MPTLYSSLTENWVLEEYRKKLEKTEGNVTFEKIEAPGPDALFRTDSGTDIWVEVTSIYENEEQAKFLNKNGLNSPNANPVTFGPTILEKFSRTLKTIEESILAKDSKKSYRSYLEKYGKGVLILYIDQPLFSDTNLKAVLGTNLFSKKLLKQFYAIYLYVRLTKTFREGESTDIEGFYSLLERSNKPPSKGEILLFQAEDGKTHIEVLLHEENVWLTINEIAQLFQIDKSGISRHLKNIFETSELQRDATVANFATVQTEGGRKIFRDLEYYNLEAIIAVGYRVNSHRGTQFRTWATHQLKEFMVKGFVLDDDRLKEPGKSHYFEALLARIRDIRSSEKVFWRKVLDIYATSIDYDPKSDLSQQFFKVVQNKMHWAAHGHTASEVIYHRADSDKPHMGMTTWSGTNPRKTDAGIAKNYLNEEELKTLNRIVTAYLEFAELQALNRQPMHMSEWSSKLDEFLKLSGRDVLRDSGKISHDAALEKATLEYEKYRKEHLNDRSAVEDHFLNFIKEIEKKQ